MDQIFCDASYKGGICGIAAVMSQKLWKQNLVDAENLDILRKISPLLQSATLEKEDMLAFFFAFPCGGINSGEIKALFLAVRLAEEILSEENRKKPVEISSDSLIALADILGTGSALFRETNRIRQKIKTKKIILSKVKAHAGHTGNTLADEWSKKARRKYESKLSGKREIKTPVKERENTALERKSELHPMIRVSPDPLHGEGLSSKNKMNQKLPLTKLILEGKASSAVIAADGRILTKNHALKTGETNFIKPCKERVWS